MHTLSLPEMGLELSEVHYPTRMNEIGKFRIKGWKNEKGINPAFFSQEAWLEELDERSYHWVVTKGPHIVAAARLSIHTSLDDVPYAHLLKPMHRVQFEGKCVASINRLVVDPDFRRAGLSHCLDLVRIERAKTKNADVVIAFPQQLRLSPLVKKGFTLIEQLENIPEMPERPFYVMSMDLALNPNPV